MFGNETKHRQFFCFQTIFWKLPNASTEIGSALAGFFCMEAETGYFYQIFWSALNHHAHIWRNTSSLTLLCWIFGIEAKSSLINFKPNIEIGTEGCTTFNKGVRYLVMRPQSYKDFCIYWVPVLRLASDSKVISHNSTKFIALGWKIQNWISVILFPCI